MLDTFSDSPLSIREVWGLALRLASKWFAQVRCFAIALFLLQLILVLVIPLVHGLVPTFYMLVSTVLVMILGSYLQAMLLYQIYIVASGDIVSIKDCLIFVNRKFITIVVSAIMVGVLAALGMVLFVLPGYFVLVLLSMILPLILFDNTGIVGALKGSCKLVWGNWWRVFSVFVLYLLLAGVMGALLGFKAGFATEFEITNLFQFDWKVLILGVVLSLFWFWYVACVLVLFYDLKLRKSRNSTVAKD